MSGMHRPVSWTPKNIQDDCYDLETFSVGFSNDSHKTFRLLHTLEIVVEVVQSSILIRSSWHWDERTNPAESVRQIATTENNTSLACLVHFVQLVTLSVTCSTIAGSPTRVSCNNGLLSNIPRIQFMLGISFINEVDFMKQGIQLS